jgi:hypothetical protein
VPAIGSTKAITLVDKDYYGFGVELISFLHYIFEYGALSPCTYNDMELVEVIQDSPDNFGTEFTIKAPKEGN